MTRELGSSRAGRKGRLWEIGLAAGAMRDGGRAPEAPLRPHFPVKS